MTREVYVLRDGELVPKHLARPLKASGVNVISDYLDGVWNPVDGQRYDSKRAYYRSVRQAGCEIVGNESMGRPRPENRMPRAGNDIKRAIEFLKSR